MEENKRIIKKGSYIWLFCFDIVFSVLNGLACVLILESGYLGKEAIAVAIEVFDIFVSIILGSVSYKKYRSVLKTHLVFAVSWIPFLCVMLANVIKKDPSAIAKALFVFCLCLSFIGSLVTMIITKVRNAVLKSKKSGVAQEPDCTEDHPAAPVKSKPRRALTVIAKIAALAIIIPPLIYMMFNVFLWSASSALSSFLFVPAPPRPEVTYGEFPFEIVYELDGETITVNDVFVCEYAGIAPAESIAKKRYWKGYIKSTGEDKFVLIEDGDLRLLCDVGVPEYYMNDYPALAKKPIPRTHLIERVPGGTVHYSEAEINELMAKHKLNLISINLSDPIENSFEYSYKKKFDWLFG